jgi:hypothetical protein
MCQLTFSESIVFSDAQINDVKVHAEDSLVVKGNFRLVPSEQNAPECNEIFRGMLAILKVDVNCNGDDVCQRDGVFLCKKLQDYEWVMISQLNWNRQKKVLLVE